MRRRLQTRRGSILVIVMVSLIFAAAALAAFLDKASNDLLVVAHVKVSNRLREDAYSALEATLGVLEDFRQADGGSLRSVNEGWGLDPTLPQDWAGWTPADGHTVTVSFEDESGKVPLMHASQTELNYLFQNAWNMSQTDAQHLVDVLEVWMHSNAPPSQVAPSPDYEQDPAPYQAPWRSLRSYSELAAIDFAKDLFYDANGEPNDMWWRFYNDFSLFNYASPNINGANVDVMTGVGQFNPEEEQNVAMYLAGQGDYVTPNPLGVQTIKSTNTLRRILGAGGDVSKFVETISALRIFVTVQEGGSTFRLEAVVAPQGTPAKAVMTNATDAHANSSNSQAGESAVSSGVGGSGPTTTPNASQTSAAASGNTNLQFPFTVLEIRENDQILTPPPNDAPIFSPTPLASTAAPAPDASAAPSTSP